MFKVTEDIIYVGVNDHEVDLFEGQYDVPNGMSYNSYVVLDEKVAVFDTVDAHFKDEWLANLEEAFAGRTPDYLIVQHMEPDHAANIENFMKVYPETIVVANTKTFTMMENFFRGMDLEGKKLVVANGESLTLGKHVLTFVFAPMVHWPEVMVTYDSTDKVLFSADGFGKFGALDVEEDWDCEARRYYIGIIGKYGPQVQKLLKTAATLDIQTICPLHGSVLTENLGHYLEKYDIWSSYKVESEGVVIAYSSVYGNTKKAVEVLAQKLEEKGCPKVSVFDLARDDMSQAVSDAFRYSKLILATTTTIGKLGFKNFEIRINERRILKAMAAYSGFAEEDYDTVFIILDKMDKIGTDGVKAELMENGYSEETADKYLELMGQATNDASGVRRMGEILAGVLEDGAAENLAQIMETVGDVSDGSFKLAFDPTLVRGMGYYTGTIFEVSMEGFGGSVAGGGRYDKMIGKFTGMDTPACGFSIGFERIVTILLENNFQVPGAAGKKAFLIEKNMPAEKLCEVLKEAKAEREAGAQVLVALMNKNKKFQKEQLSKEGYTEFKEFFCR